MSDRTPPDKNKIPPRTPQSQMGLGVGDQQASNMSGIAPAVVDAFLNAANFKKAAPGPVTDPEPPAEVQPSPRVPTSLGAFANVDAQAVADRQLKIRHLREAMAAMGKGDAAVADKPAEDAAAKPAAAPADTPEAAPAAAEVAIPPPPGPGRSPSGKLTPDDIRARHLAMRKPPGGGPAPPAGTGRLAPGQSRPGTGRLPAAGTGLLPGAGAPGGPAATGGPPAANDIRLQHLAMRRQQAGTTSLSEADARLERLVENALASDGVVALRQTIAVLEDKALPGKLGALTERVTELVPGSDGVVKLGADVGKRVLVNNLNPVIALSVAAKESAERFDSLKKWNDLSQKERVAAMAGLSGNLAEILGAVTPPPVNYGAQLVGAGFTLVSLAAEHSDTFEDVAAKAAQAEPTRKVASELSERGAVLAHQVKAAWGELGDRLETLKAAKLKPRAPRQLQQLFDSPKFKKLKKNPATRNLAEGMENLTYNLTKRWDNTRETWAHQLGRLKRKKAD